MKINVHLNCCGFHFLHNLIFEILNPEMTPVYTEVYPPHLLSSRPEIRQGKH